MRVATWAELRSAIGERVAVDAKGCFLWQGSNGRDGYGFVTVNGKVWRAHRVAWMAAHETYLGAGALVLHSCDTPACVHPSHLRAGTHRDNMDDRIERGPRGETHGRRVVLTEENVRAIRAIPRSVTNKTIADMFGVSTGAVSGVRTGRNWRHV